jgi:hypothetical protein
MFADIRLNKWFPFVYVSDQLLFNKNGIVMNSGYIENDAYVLYFITTSQIEKVTNEITGPIKLQDFYSCDVVIKYDA